MVVVEKQEEEMNECGVLNGGKVVTSSVSSPPQEKGRKNKRKLADPSPQQTAGSLTEFPRYELHSLKSQNSLCENDSNGQLKVEESESLGWDDPFACQLEQLLSSNLHNLFRNAMNQIMDCGYSEDVVLKAISSSRLYCGGNDLVSNIVNDTLSFLKSGKKVAGSRDYVFEDLQQLVAYTLVEKISLVREVRPSLSTVEAMWRLLMCDLNVLQAFEVEGEGFEGSSGSNANKTSETQGAEGIPPKSTDSDNSKSPVSNTQCSHSDPVKFGNFPNVNNSKNPHASGGATPGKEVFSVTTASAEGTKSASLTSVSDEKLVSCRKGRTKKELAMLRQKSCVEKIRTYSKGGGYKTAKFGGFLVEKRSKAASDLLSAQARNSSSKITTTEVVKIPLAESSGSSTLSTSNSTKSDTPALDVKEYVTALPANNAPAIVASEKKSSSQPEEKASVSTKPAPDYYAAIPYDASLGIYVPRNKRDELILKLVPRMKDLQKELQDWTDWANQKVKQATVRLLKDQPELKALRKEKEEAEEFRKEKQLLEENTMKRRSEMELALNNATNQIERANNTVRRLELEQSLLKRERDAANIRAAESAESCREAKERVQRSLKNAQSWEGQKVLLQEELKSQRNKVAELQQEVAKAKTRQNQIEATWKQEKAAKGKLAAQAAALKKERVKLEEFGKAEEERIKTKAENDVKYYIENIKRLESEISKLELKSDGLKIAALKKGIDGNKSGMNHTTTTKANTMAGAKVWENNHGEESKIKRERECVMCLCEEMSVIFLPCAHQVLCSKCNQLHEKEAMEDCPSCRAKIQRRIQARFARG
ncbi:PREDICTED: putative E3 ubiquitin-protein ligase RF298 isoform X1 [Camelina sativa]|uniref:E3 ubiquitin-protein ligase RF298 isoform X1 n=1 Tax=Camelina sativa TaxID=90675 RepID=A0ABM0TSJ7_CAMSA|nr:PREDICTED: putative E3 ubiquitin-protein ligase RF298 isoform X1 [Camelina sativa]